VSHPQRRSRQDGRAGNGKGLLLSLLFIERKRKGTRRLSSLKTLARGARSGASDLLRDVKSSFRPYRIVSGGIGRKEIPRLEGGLQRGSYGTGTTDVCRTHRRHV